MDNLFMCFFLIIYILPLTLFIFYLLYHTVSCFRIKKDYSQENFKSIGGLVFMKYCKLPSDRCFFKKHLYYTETALPTVLPTFDMNDYDFEGVPISNCSFTKNTILPNDSEFFQKIKDKSIYNCTLPDGDYSIYNFKGVYLNAVKFPKNAILPLKYSFFKELRNGNYVYFYPPKSFADNCHLYDLSKTVISTRRPVFVSKRQELLIRYKNKGELYSFLKQKKSVSEKIKLLLETIKVHSNTLIITKK